MNILIVVNVLNGLQQATSDRSNPQDTGEVFDREQTCEWARTALRDDVESVPKFKRVENVGDMRVTKLKQLMKFGLS